MHIAVNMDAEEHSRLVALSRAMSDWYVDLDTDVAYPERSLQRAAFQAILREMISIGERYPDTMRVIGDDVRAKRNLLVITARHDLYILRRRENSQMFVDFPHYNNDIVLPVNPHLDQYYKIEVAVKDLRYPDPDEYVFAAIGIPGFIEGKVFQPIKLIRPNGGLSLISQLAQSVLFAVGFD